MNTFGKNFKLTIFGESHGSAVGVVVDGCPAGIPLTEKDFDADLQQRKAGQKGTTPRTESDRPEILSGIFNGHTTGTPITIIFQNKNTNSADYTQFRKHPRPGHADFVAEQKYHGFQDYRGGGHFSGRLTLGLVAAGVIAKKTIPDIVIGAELIEVAGSSDIDAAMEEAVKQKDSVGGIAECRATNIPAGLGEPFFDSVESVISHLAFSIPGIKGIEFGAGFAASRMKGSKFNDLIINKKGETATNHSGGINGGISNGNDLIFRVAVRPTASTPQPQESYNFETEKIDEMIIKGRHDLCIALRIPVVIESVTAIALTDFLISDKKL
ncbi:MAG: chorismate synthase [Bacteroidales bacterium]|nr:chorismate synthase [Bacteroidales bacterium]